MANITLTEVQDGEQYILEKRNKHKANLPAWDAFGGNMSYQTKVPCYPGLYTTIQAMAKPASWLWWEIVKLRDRETNISIYRAKDKVAGNQLTAGYKELHSLDLVKRVKRQHYIINPAAMLPAFSKYDDVLKVWKETE